MNFPSSLIKNAVEAISSFPGIGKKTALRLAIYLLRIIQRDMKRRIEQGVYEQDRDLWSKWHDYITDMIKTILNG